MSKARRKNNKYSVELKLQAVQDYIAGKGSYEALKEIYGLRSSYNGHKEFKERTRANS